MLGVLPNDFFCKTMIEEISNDDGFSGFNYEQEVQNSKINKDTTQLYSLVCKLADVIKEKELKILELEQKIRACKNP